MTSVPLYPLRFQPLFKRAVWGGHNLSELLQKKTGRETCSESWEICDRIQDECRVAYGPLSACTLFELNQKYKARLWGDTSENRFPLLFKFLDAQQHLSIQVHPDDRLAQKAIPCEKGKSEAWYVLHAEPESTIYAGLNPSAMPEDLEYALHHSTLPQLMHRISAEKGDCLYIPAGMVHALGKGIVVAEIQQSSDITYRLFDWDRLDVNGNKRELHIEKGLEAIDYSLALPHVEKYADYSKSENSQLISCDYFTMHFLRKTVPFTLIGDGRFAILVNIAGTAAVSDSYCNKFFYGEVIFLPAECRLTIEPTPEIELLYITP